MICLIGTYPHQENSVIVHSFKRSEHALCPAGAATQQTRRLHVIIGTPSTETCLCLAFYDLLRTGPALQSTLRIATHLHVILVGELFWPVLAQKHQTPEEIRKLPSESRRRAALGEEDPPVSIER